MIASSINSSRILQRDTFVFIWMRVCLVGFPYWSSVTASCSPRSTSASCCSSRSIGTSVSRSLSSSRILQRDTYELLERGRRRLTRHRPVDASTRDGRFEAELLQGLFRVGPHHRIRASARHVRNNRPDGARRWSLREESPEGLRWACSSIRPGARRLPVESPREESLEVQRWVRVPSSRAARLESPREESRTCG